MLQQLRKDRANVYYLLSWVIFILSIITVYINISTGKIPRGWLYTSDTLYLPALYQDLFTNYDISGWKLTPTPYFFPDMVIYFLLNALTNNFHLAIAAYGVLQSLLFMASLLILSNQLFGFRKVVHSLFLVVGAIFFLLLSTGNYYTFLFILQSAHHFSVLLIMPVAFTLVLQIIANHSNTTSSTWLLVVLSILAIASDIIYAIQFLIPVMGSIFFLALLSIIPFRRMMLLNFLLASSILGGTVLNKIIIRYEDISHYTEITQKRITESGLNFLVWLKDFSASYLFLSLLWISFMFLVIWLLISFLKKLFSHKQTINTNLLLTNAFFLLVVVTSLTVVLVSGNFEASPSVRYLIPVLIIPIFFGWPFFIAGTNSLLTILEKHYGMFALSVVLCLTPFFIVPVQRISALSELSDYRPSFVRCLDEKTRQKEIRNGLAHYWQAKYSSLLSKNNLHIVQVDPYLSPYHWINNLNWYQADFEFVIIDKNAPIQYKIDETWVANRFGQPASTFDCEGSTIFVYNKPEDIQFQNQFKGHPSFATFENINDEFEFYGFNLPSLTGEVIGLSRGASETWENKAGFLTYGPYVSLPGGDYYFEIHYYAEGGNIPIGNWEIVIAYPTKADVIKEGNIVAQGKNIISSTFTFREKQKVEIRVYYGGSGTLVVDKIKIRRITTTSGNVAHALSKPNNRIPTVDRRDLAIISPKDGDAVDRKYIDFIWKWRGEPLAQNQAFEIRLWQKGDPFHYGAHDARDSVNTVRQVGDVYTMRLFLDGVYSVNLHGEGDYLWTVAIVGLEPIYQDFNIEAQPYRLRVNIDKTN